jgi:hypothetical protein
VDRALLPINPWLAMKSQFHQLRRPGVNEKPVYNSDPVTIHKFTTIHYFQVARNRAKCKHEAYFLFRCQSSCLYPDRIGKCGFET